MSNYAWGHWPARGRILSPLGWILCIKAAMQHSEWAKLWSQQFLASVMGFGPETLQIRNMRIQWQCRQEAIQSAQSGTDSQSDIDRNGALDDQRENLRQNLGQKLSQKLGQIIDRNIARQGAHAKGFVIVFQDLDACEDSARERELLQSMLHAIQISMKDVGLLEVKVQSGYLTQLGDQALDGASEGAWSVNSTEKQIALLEEIKCAISRYGSFSQLYFAPESWLTDGARSKLLKAVGDEQSPAEIFLTYSPQACLRQTAFKKPAWQVLKDFKTQLLKRELE